MSYVDPIPPRCHTVNLYLVVPDAVEALAFYANAFGAEMICRMPGPGGQGTMHAEMSIGDSTVMLMDEFPEYGMKSPKSLGGICVAVHLYVEDADSLFARAAAAGCTVLHPMSDMFWGDRFGKVADPYGHHWGIATHKEDVDEAELQRRSTAACVKE